MIQSNFSYLFATSVKYSDYKTSPFVHKLAQTYSFGGHGFHTPVEWKIGYKVIKKQAIIQNLILNTAFYIYCNIRLKEINLFNQIQENTISGSDFSARLWLSYPTIFLVTTDVFYSKQNLIESCVIIRS